MICLEGYGNYSFQSHLICKVTPTSIAVPVSPRKYRISTYLAFRTIRAAALRNRICSSDLTNEKNWGLYLSQCMVHIDTVSKIMIKILLLLLKIIISISRFSTNLTTSFFCPKFHSSLYVLFFRFHFIVLSTKKWPRESRWGSVTRRHGSESWSPRPRRRSRSCRMLEDSQIFQPSKQGITPPPNITPKNRPSPKENSSSNHQFARAVLVSFREGINNVSRATAMWETTTKVVDVDSQRPLVKECVLLGLASTNIMNHRSTSFWVFGCFIQILQLAIQSVDPSAGQNDHLNIS